jgi:hypothetical protein
VSASAVQVTTRNITASDVRSVVAQMGVELQTLTQFAQSLRIHPTFTLDKVIVDLSLLALNDILASIHLQFHQGNQLVREHAFIICDEGRQSAGPAANLPPLPRSLPPGTELRLVVKRNPAVSKAQCDAWFERLDWGTTSALQVPAHLRRNRYGSFGSGGYGIDRILIAGPDEDEDFDDYDGYYED